MITCDELYEHIREGVERLIRNGNYPEIIRLSRAEYNLLLSGGKITRESKSILGMHIVVG